MAARAVAPAQDPQRTYWVLMLVPLFVLGALYVYPLGKVLWMSVTVPEPGLGNYAALIDNAALRRILGVTFRICLITTVFAVGLGYLVAYVMLHVRPLHQLLILFCVLLSFWMSVLIRAFAWIALLQPRGLVNSTLLGLGVIDQPLALVRNELGVIIGMVHYMLPYAILPLLANMQGLNPALVPAARGLGASPRAAFLRVFLPLTAPGIFAASVLVFIFSLGFFVTPAILGGGRTVMVAEYISLQVVETLNWGLGTMIASSLLVSVLLMVVVAARFVDMRRMFGAGT